MNEKLEKLVKEYLFSPNMTADDFAERAFALGQQSAGGWSDEDMSEAYYESGHEDFGDWLSRRQMKQNKKSETCTCEHKRCTGLCTEGGICHHCWKPIDETQGEAPETPIEKSVEFWKKEIESQRIEIKLLKVRLDYLSNSCRADIAAAEERARKYTDEAIHKHQKY